MPAGSAEQRTGRLAELDALIYLGFGDVPGWMLPLLCRRRLYTLRRRAHPRRLARRAGYEPPEVRRAIYLAETGRVEVADRVTASQDVSTRRKAPARAGRRGGAGNQISAARAAA